MASFISVHIAVILPVFALSFSNAYILEIYKYVDGEAGYARVAAGVIQSVDVAGTGLVLCCPAHVVQWSNHLGVMCSRA